MLHIDKLQSDKEEASERVEFNANTSFTTYSFDYIAKIPPSATQFGSILTLSNTIIGGGLLSIPYGFSCTGLILGLIILVMIASLSTLSSAFLVRCTNKSKQEALIEIIPSYRDLAIQCWGRFGAVIVDLTFITLLIGALTGYLIIISELVQEYFKYGDVGYVCATFLISIFIIIPLSMIDRLHHLRITSLIALLCDLYFLIIVIYSFIQAVISDEDPEWTMEEIEFFRWDVISIFMGFPIIAFAYIFHMSVLPIYDELKNRSEGKMLKIIYISIFISTFFYVLVGTLGYLTYGSQIKGNVLVNIQGNGNELVVLCKLVFAVGLIFSFPVLNFVQIMSLDNLLFRSIYGFAEKRVWFEPVNTQGKSETNNVVDGSRGICCVQLGRILPEQSVKRRLFLTVISVMTMALISVLIPDIEIVFGFVGATSGTLTVFIFPGLFIYHLDSEKNYRVYAIMIILFGIVTGVLCIISTMVEVGIFIRDYPESAQ